MVINYFFKKLFFFFFCVEILYIDFLFKKKIKYLLLISRKFKFVVGVFRVCLIVILVKIIL